MQNLPSKSRASTKILKDLLKLRKQLSSIENSDEPYIKKDKTFINKGLLA